MPRRIRAFTLIELLVIISLIVLLISMLQPAMGKAKKRARTVKCQAQVDQMSTAFISLSDDHQGRLFPITHGQGEYWFSRLLPYMSDDERVLLCPEASADSNHGGRGDAFHAWGPGGGFMDNKKGSYGMNLWLLPKGAFATDHNMRQEGYIRHTDNAPSDIPTFADSPWVGAWPDEGDYFPINLTYGFQRHQKFYFMGRFCVDRHEYAINVGFMDGSARNVRLPDLWKLRWHKTMEPGEPGPEAAN